MKPIKFDMDFIANAAGYPVKRIYVDPPVPEPEDARPGCIAKYGGDPDGEDKAHEDSQQQIIDEK